MQVRLLASGLAGSKFVGTTLLSVLKAVVLVNDVAGLGPRLSKIFYRKLESTGHLTRDPTVAPGNRRCLPIPELTLTRIKQLRLS
jgi:hypothetical protein